MLTVLTPMNKIRLLRVIRLYPIPLLVGLACGTLTPGVSFAQEVPLPGLSTQLGDSSTFYVASGVQYDNNLFRDVSGAERSETITTVAAGLNLDLPLSRQRLLLNASVNHNVFDEFDFLNYTGADANAELQWVLGRRWTGGVGFDFERTLSGFEERTVTDPDSTSLKDIRTRKRGFVGANYQLTPRWQLRAGVESQSLDLDEREVLDRDSDSARAGVRYTSRANNFVEVESEFTDTSFPNPQRDAGMLIDNDYKQSELRGAVNYRFSDSRIDGRLGYLKREYDQNSERDFDGLVGRLSYDWRITGKTRLNVAARREITSFTDVLGAGGAAGDDVVSNFILIEGISITPSYAPTAKLELRGRLSYEERDYEDQSIALGEPERKDDVLVTGITLGYTPLRNIQVNLSYEKQDRESSIDELSFDVDLVSAGLRVDF